MEQRYPQKNPFRPVTKSRSARSRKEKPSCATGTSLVSRRRASGQGSTCICTTSDSRNWIWHGLVTTEQAAWHGAHAEPATFLGYPRADGRVGTRNYIAVVAASNCAAHTSELIAASFADEPLPPNVDGVIAFPHGEGCGQAIGPDTVQLQRTLQGVLDHPNVSAALILGLGCEVNQVSHYLGRSPKSAATVHRPLSKVSHCRNPAARAERSKLHGSKCGVSSNARRRKSAPRCLPLRSCSA